MVSKPMYVRAHSLNSFSDHEFIVDAMDVLKPMPQASWCSKTLGLLIDGINARFCFATVHWSINLSFFNLSALIPVSIMHSPSCSW